MLKISNILNKPLIKIYNTPWLFFLLISVFSFWPVSFLLCSLQYDMMDVVLPWRHFVSECLKSGNLPLWNLYQQCGYPIHADLQYPIWYPEVVFLGSTLGYSNITLHFLFISYVALAGLGMYKLAKEFEVSHHFSLIAGVSFMLSGIFVGHAQSLVSILGGTWLPWVIAYYTRTIKAPFCLLNLLKLTLVTFLMMTGGYQAVSFMLFYLLLALFAYQFVVYIRKNDRKMIRHLIMSNVLLVIFILTLSTGILFSLYYVFPFIDRLHGISLKASQGYSFTPRCLISLFLPAATIKSKEFFATDISMSNGFIGVLILLTGILGIFRRNPGKLSIILIFGIVFLFASFGKYTPVQQIFYRYVPFMNLFFYPNFYRYYTMLAIILMAVYYLSHHFEKRESIEKKNLLVLISVTAILYIIAVVYALTKVSIQHLTYFNTNLGFFYRFKESNIYENILVQGLIQISLLGLFVFLLYFKRFPFRWIFFITVILEMYLAVQFNSPVTVYGQANPLEIKEILKRFPRGFPIPDDVAIERNSDRLQFKGIFWRNLGNFNKQVSWNGFTSFALNPYNKLNDNYPSLRDSVLKNNLIYLSDDVRPLSSLTNNTPFSHRTLFIDDADIKDTVIENSNNLSRDTVLINKFQPSEIICQVNARKNEWLTLMQSNYIGWQVYIDGKPSKHINSNLLFMSTFIPAGEHIVTFRFNLPLVRAGFYLSYIGFIILIISLSILYLRNRSGKHDKLVGLLLIILLFISVISIIINIKKYNQINQNNRDITELSDWSRSNSKDSTLFIICRDNLNDSCINNFNDNFIFYQGFRNENLSGLSERLINKHFQGIYYSRLNVLENPAFLAMLVARYPRFVIRQSERDYSQVCFFNDEIKSTNNVRTYAIQTDSNYWKIKDKIDSSSCNSVPLVFLMDTDCLYGSIFTIEIKDLPEYPGRVLSFTGELQWKQISESYLVIQVERKNKIISYNSIDLRKFGSKQYEWNLFSHAIWLSGHLKKNDIVKVYAWNPGKSIFRYKNLKINVFATKTKSG